MISFIPLLGEEVIFKDQVVCLDVGVHVDGYVGDNALTIDLSGKYQKLVEASRKALVEAIKIIKPGLEIREIGKKIHEVITRYGYSPIRNLSGHGVDKYKIHTKPSMPNYDNGDTTKLEEGQAIAIEPFASTGAGVIYESGQANIYMLIKKKPVRNTMTREVLAEIEKMKGLPFTLRWLVKKFGEGKTKFAIREMTNYGMLTEFPPLVDKNHGIVSQAENTIIVTTDGAKITTKS